LESTNPSILRPLAAQSVALGLGLASVAVLTARTGLAPTPTPKVPREFQLGQPSQPLSLAPRWQSAQIPIIKFPVIRSLIRPKPPIRLDLASPADLEAILGLIEEASRWLKAQGKDQWAVPWPNREERDARVLKGLVNRKTVIVRQGDTAVATVTMANWYNPKVWVSGPSCTADLTERAVYLHRLITARKYAGHGLGESLITWAEKRARAMYGAQRTRIDVWTTNTDLHRYYQKLGFESRGRCPDPSYPSGALFERPIVSGRSMPLPR
jgi:ribosomal protein S18 acetylase RimI-like enzyme